MIASLGLAAGCGHKDKPAETSTTTGSATPTPPPRGSDDMKPEPVAKQPPPAPPAEAVPPTAADLDGYLKDIPGSGKLMADFETNLGTIHCELYPDKTPMTVANFVGLATGKKAWKNPKTDEVETGKPYFDGLTFHRVIAGFMIQGGDPLGEGYGGPGYMFGNEFVKGLQMGPGALAMANADDPSVGRVGTNGSQFFIMEGSRPDLVGHHTIFGQCKDLDVVKKITAVQVDQNDKPLSPVTIEHVTIHH